MRVVDILVDKGVFQHLARIELHKQVSSHIVCQVGHDYGTATGLVNRSAVYLKEVQVSVNVHLAVLIVENGRGGQDLAVILRKVKQGLELVDVRALHEVRWVKRHVKPAWHRQLLETVDTVVWLLVNSHVHGKLLRIEVEHNSLLTEAESRECPSDHIVYVIVQGLLDVDGGRVDERGVLTDFGEGSDALLEFEVAPPVLDPVRGSPLDNHVDRVLLEAAAEERRADVLLNHREVGCAVKKGLEEAQELLVLVRVNRAVVVEDGEEDLDDQLDGRALEDEEVVVLVEKDHLIEEGLAFAAGQLSLQVGHLEVVVALAELREHAVRRLRCVGVQEVFECELFVGSLVQPKSLVISNDGLLAKGGHDELQKRKGLPLEEIRLFNTDRLVLSVFDDAVEGVVQGQTLLLEQGNLAVKNLYKLRLLLLEEVDLGVLAKLEGVYETGVFHEATTVVGLDLERGG